MVSSWIKRTLCLGALLCAQAAQATPLKAAFRGWWADVGAPDAVLVALHKGQLHSRVELGLRADAPVELQSNSKAITAHCLRALVGQGLVSWDSSVSDILGTPSEISIADLVTHSSGLWPDSTQGRAARWRGDPRPLWRQVTERALARAAAKPRGAFHYNNENYAVLGSVIEALTGEPYADACNTRAIAPRGATSARLSPRFGAYGPFGGWQMSALDFARFHHHAYSGAAAAPAVPVGKGVHYGLAAFQLNAGHAKAWHFGALCFWGKRDDSGSYVVSYGAEWTVFVAYRACPKGTTLRDLDRAIAAALGYEQ